MEEMHWDACPLPTFGLGTPPLIALKRACILPVLSGSLNADMPMLGDLQLFAQTRIGELERTACLSYDYTADEVTIPQVVWITPCCPRRRHQGGCCSGSSCGCSGTVVVGLSLLFPLSLLLFSLSSSSFVSQRQVSAGCTPESAGQVEAGSRKLSPG
jgi:hypothetical protein